MPSDPIESDYSVPSPAAIHQALLSSRTGYYLLLHHDLHIAWVSRCISDAYGVTPASVAGRPLAKVFDGDVEEVVEDVRRRGVNRPSSRGYCLRIRQAEGRSLCVHAFFYPLQIEGRPYWFVDAAPLCMEAEFDRLKSDFVANVSHELRTPLSSIAGALGLVAAGATGEVGDDTLQIVQVALNNTHRLIRLINDLLDVERIAIGKLHFDMARHSLRGIVQSSIEDLRPLATRQNVRFAYADDGGPDMVHVDSDRLTQVMMNILSNAIKFSPSHSLVQVVVTTDNAFHRVEIIDSGVGIPEEFRSRMFQKFAQADIQSNRKASGLGLGLAISREITDRLGGKLWFRPNPEGGSIFCVEIPAVE